MNQETRFIIHTIPFKREDGKVETEKCQNLPTQAATSSCVPKTDWEKNESASGWTLAMATKGTWAKPGTRMEPVTRCSVQGNEKN